MTLPLVGETAWIGEVHNMFIKVAMYIDHRKAKKLFGWNEGEYIFRVRGPFFVKAIWTPGGLKRTRVSRLEYNTFKAKPLLRQQLLH